MNSNTLKNDYAHASTILQSVVYPPQDLYYRGNLTAIDKRIVAVVGSRKPTPYGREVTKMICAKLADSDISVISGLAFGIDAQAHESTLDNNGCTIAVLPAGLHTIYPKSNEWLARSIVQNDGLLLSEYSPKIPAFKSHFIARNRIIASLASAVIVVEATIKSGTSSTVRFALEANVPVMCVPGNITSVLSEGTNQLIKSGAHPVCSAQDVLDLLTLTSTSVAGT